MLRTHNYVSVLNASRKSVIVTICYFYYSFHRIRGSSIHNNGGCGISRSVCYSEGERASAELHVTLFTEDGTAHSNIHVYVYIVNTIIVIYTPKNITTAGRHYTHTEINTVISGRLCIDIPIINNYFPGSDVQFSLRAASASHNISTIPSTVSILDDGTCRWLKIMNACSLCDVFL